MAGSLSSPEGSSGVERRAIEARRRDVIGPVGQAQGAVQRVGVRRSGGGQDSSGGEMTGVRRWRAKSVAYDLRWGEEGNEERSGFGRRWRCESDFLAEGFCWEMEKAD